MRGILGTRRTSGSYVALRQNFVRTSNHTSDHTANHAPCPTRWQRTTRSLSAPMILPKHVSASVVPLCCEPGPWLRVLSTRDM